VLIIRSYLNLCQETLTGQRIFCFTIR
jgi:hypothetical protein